MHARGGLHANRDLKSGSTGRASCCHLTSRRPGRPCSAKNSKTDITTCPSLYSYTASRPRDGSSSCGSTSLLTIWASIAISSPRTGPTSPGEYSGSPTTRDEGGVDFKTNGAKYISASRRVVVFSLHSNDSCPSHDDVGGFFFEFEAIRTASTEMLRAGTSARTGR